MGLYNDYTLKELVILLLCVIIVVPTEVGCDIFYLLLLN